LAETSDFKAKPPVGIDPIGASSGGASLYELIREDLIEGRLAVNERLVVADLVLRHGTSTNPVREAPRPDAIGSEKAREHPSP
jgi:DNA-binding GntR family transcriptional regulator